MELQNILSALDTIDDAGTEKTASAEKQVEAEKVSNARDKLLTALDDAMSPTTEKTAAVGTPATGELVKMASELAASDSEALTKEAHLYGAAVADGFMSRLGQYESATAGAQPAATTKVASADGVPTEAEFEKFAQENPDMVKQAAELGYLHGKQQIEGLKKEAFDKGYTDANAEIAELSKTAEGRAQLATVSQEMEKEASVNAEVELAFEKVAENLAKTPAGRAKLAAIKLGQADGMVEIEKTANDCFERGYNDTINMLRMVEL